MEKRRLNILVVDEDIANISYFTLIALGHVPYINIHVLTTGVRRLDPLKYSKYISSYRSVKRDADEDFTETIRLHAEKTNSSVIMPVTERTMKYFSIKKNELQQFAGIPPVASTDVLNQVTDKSELHDWLKVNGFPVAKSILGDVNANELIDSVTSLRFPVLIKPVHGSAGTGILKFESLPEIRDYILDTERKDWDQLIIQEYIQGSDIDISALCRNGDILNYTIQRGLNNNKLRFSTAIEFIEDEHLLTLSGSIFRKLDFSGIAHLDFRLSKESSEYFLVDFNARFWSSILGSLEAGINFPLEYVKTALNEPVLPVNYRKMTYYFSGEAVRSFFHFNRTDSIKKVRIGNSQLKYNLKDPVPGMISIIKKLSHQ